MIKGEFPHGLNADGTPKRVIMDSEEQKEEDQHTKDVVKLAIKEAITEWLNQKFLDFGRWTFLSACAVLLAP